MKSAEKSRAIRFFLYWLTVSPVMSKIIQLECMLCGKISDMPAEYLGSQVVCPYCQETLETVPADPSPSPQPGEAGKRRCSYCLELGHNIRSCEIKKFWDGIEADKQKAAKVIDRLKKRVVGHNQTLAQLKRDHEIALWEAKRRADSDFNKPFIVKHWPTAAGLCGGILSLGNQHFEMIPFPEIVLPLSLACTIGVVLFFVFYVIRFGARKMVNKYNSGEIGTS